MERVKAVYFPRSGNEPGTGDAASGASCTPQLPIGRYRLRFVAWEPVRFPEYSGSAWRGAFGHQLKRAVCVTREPVCARCMLYRGCAYPYIFETPPPPDARKMRRYIAAPHPFVLLPDPGGRVTVDAGDRVELGLTLFGHGNRSLPYIVHAFRRAADEGIGKRSGRLDLSEVWQAAPPESADWQPVYRSGGPLNPLAASNPVPPYCPTRLTITFETPMRLRREGRNVRPEDFRFSDLFGNLLRRVSMLTYFHTDTPLDTDYAALTRAAREIAIENMNLEWHDWARYSSRQQTTMEMGGLKGTIELDGARLAPFWPYLWLGQYTHAGKGTSMGLGHYTIKPASL